MNAGCLWIKGWNLTAQAYRNLCESGQMMQLKHVLIDKNNLYLKWPYN